MQEALLALRRRLATLEPASGGPAVRFTSGCAALDAGLGGGLEKGGLHEVLAAARGDMPAAAGFVAGMALRAAAGRCLAWVREAAGEAEAGHLYPPGLAGLGLDPARLLLVRVRRPADALRAGLEAARCPALGCVVIELCGAPEAVDFTTSRRLSLAAEGSGVPVILLRGGVSGRGARPAEAGGHPNTARTRWRVAADPSCPLAAAAPGPTAFDVTLLRHRAGAAGARWRLEWDHGDRSFRAAAPVSGPVAAVPVGRPAAATGDALRSTG